MYLTRLLLRDCVNWGGVEGFIDVKECSQSEVPIREVALDSVHNCVDG